MARPSMRLACPIAGIGRLRDSLKAFYADHRGVGPALIEHFLAGDDDALAFEIFEHQVGRRTVKIIDGLARIEALQRKVGRRLDANTSFNNSFPADHAFDQDLFGRRGGRGWCRRGDSDGFCRDNRRGRGGRRRPWRGWGWGGGGGDDWVGWGGGGAPGGGA